MRGGVSLAAGSGVSVQDTQHVTTANWLPRPDTGVVVSDWDAEPGTQFVQGCSGLIAGDEFLNLVGVKLACPSGFGPAHGWGLWRPATPEAPARGD